MDPTIPPLPMLGEQDATAPPNLPSRMCVCTVGDSQYAVDLRHVREVFPIESITPMPGVPPIVIGMTNVRGSVVPVVDLRLLLGLPQPTLRPLFAVVLRHEEYQLAVLVDCSPEIVSVLPEQFGPTPNNSPADSDARRFIVNGGIKIDEAYTAILEVTQVVAYLESDETIEHV